MPAGAGRRRSRPVQPRGLVPLGAAAAAAPAAYGYATAAAPADAEGGFKPEQLDPEQWMAVLSQAQHNRIVACEWHVLGGAGEGALARQWTA